MMKRIIALLLVLSTTLLFGCNIEFVDPNAGVDGSSGGSAIVKPNGGTTTKPNGGTTGGNTTGGSTSKPDSGTTGGNTTGGSTSKPDSGTTGGNTTGGSTSKPDSGTTGGNTTGGSTSKPDSGTTGGNTTGGSTTTPDSGTTGGNTTGGSTITPDSGTTGGNTTGGSTTTPDSGTTGGNTTGGSTSKPDSGTSGGTTIVPDDKPVTPPEPTSSTDINFIYPKLKAAFDAFSARSSYQTVMSGKTVAGSFNQNINSTVYHANEMWQSDYESTGLVDLYHHVYVSGNNTVYSEKKDNSKKKAATIADYRKKFGVAPCDYQLGGYKVDLTTITSASYNKDASGKVTFVINVNGNMSTDMLVQMVKFGGLAATPTFSKLTFTIVCENGADISSYDTYAEYKIQKKVVVTMNMDATMNLTTTVSDYKGTVTFPKV